MIRINLHIHSTCSDGAFGPLELVRLLRRHKVAVASLTDHDTAEGVVPFLAGCRRQGIRGVAGVELSSDSPEGELHILGYRFDLSSPELSALMERSRVARRERNLAICELLNGLGIPIVMEEIEAVAGGRVVGRPHIAQVLRERGHVASVREAFVRYLGRGAAAYVPRSLSPVEECIRVVRAAGGLPVWAHPLVSLPDPDRFEPVLDRLKGMGLWGVECWFQGADTAQVLRCLTQSGRRGLYATGGSDFHGRPGHPARIAGCLVEDDLLPWARFCGGL
ncbi:PHP domain-containing protein [Fretibacterium sp. OH1220_COT-178]|uniref:PHP domain-containing protein n=1 Tax=Fretibacterium sp. OH1220_COT-178 TaxID=2491047 RepID=UPI000F5E7526|nr:PHP domain-containing protein [Fretibacterium sp. OH1220_COT-178]RRD64038.1 PHP domain-containing protein [Fretibacterium sp. OH1220_COT-178]